MIDPVIFEGLKEALEKGEDLMHAMMSFYNAGYVKEQIEQAARAIQMQQRGQPFPVRHVPPVQPQPMKIQKKVKTPPPQRGIPQTPIKPIQRVSNYGPATNVNKESLDKIKYGINSAIDQLNRIEFPNRINKAPAAVQNQKISGYGIKSDSKNAIVALVIIMIVLLGILGAVFLFREQILSFFDNSSFFSGLFHS